MKKILTLLIATSLLSFGQDGQGLQEEKEKEWKVIAQPDHLSIGNGVRAFIDQATTAAQNGTEEKAILKSLKDLVAGKPATINPKDLLKLKKVRSTQISQLGVFRYSYFNCRFKSTESGIFFEKTSGSQRKSGLVFENTEDSLIFLGASTVNEETQRKYSGLTGSQNKEHDSVGVIIKRGKTYLMIIPGKKNSFEIYEFK